MKNALRVIAIVLVAAILFGVGYGVGSSKGINVTVKYSNEGGATSGTPSVNTNTAPQQTPQQNTQTQTPPAEDKNDAPAEDKNDAPAEDKNDAPAEDKNDAPAEDKNDAPSEDKGSKIPSGTAAIVKAYNNAINDTKKFQGTVSVHKVGTMKINLDDCSVSFLTSSINKILQGLIKDSDSSWTFTNGQHVWEDGSITELNKIVPPGGGREAKLAEAGVASATATDNGDGTYTMVIKLVAEKSTFDGATGATVNPSHNESVVDPLNLATLEVPSVTITKADMDYPGTTLEATVNGDGLLTKLVVDLPMQGGGTGNAMGASLDVVISGGAHDTYDFTY